MDKCHFALMGTADVIQRSGFVGMDSHNGTRSNLKAKRIKQLREFDFFRYPKRRIALMFLYYGWEYEGLVQQQDTVNTVSEIWPSRVLGNSSASDCIFEM